MSTNESLPVTGLANIRIQAHDDLPSEASATVDAGLGEFNDQVAPLHEVQPLSCFARDAGEHIVGGAVGRRWGPCCELQQLWVAADARAKGLGTQLLEEFERHARAKGCASVSLETYDFQAPSFYLRRGYAVEFVRRDFPHDIVKFHMCKSLCSLEATPGRTVSTSGLLTYRCLSPDSEADVDALYSLFQHAADYSLLVEGKLPTREEARDELTSLPPGLGLSDKFFIGFWMDRTLVGCADILRSYPEAQIAYLGLLLFSPAHQGRGLGVLALNRLTELARSWHCHELRLAVIDKNERALQFWQREGFRELYRKSVSGFTGDAIVMHKTPL